TTGEWQSVAYAPGFNLNVSPVLGPGNGLSAIEFGQFPMPGGGAPFPRNDDWFFRAIWRPSNYAPRSITFGFDLHPPPPENPTILLDVGEHDPSGNIIYRSDTWGYNHPVGGFTVVPAPATVMLFLGIMWRFAS